MGSAHSSKIHLYTIGMVGAELETEYGWVDGGVVMGRSGCVVSMGSI